MEKWYAVYDKQSKELYSTGTIIEIDKIPDHLEVKELTEEPDFSMKKWDSQMLEFKEKTLEETRADKIDKVDKIDVILQEIISIKKTMNEILRRDR